MKTEAFCCFTQGTDKPRQVWVNLRLVRTAEPVDSGTLLTFDQNHAIVITASATDVGGLLEKCYDERREQ